MLNLTSDLHGNALLCSLPAPEWKEIARHLELIELRSEQRLYDPGQQMQYVYFPTTSIISLLHMVEDGASTEIAAVGREGMTGLPVLTGGKFMPTRVQVQFPGSAYRIKAHALRELIGRSAFLRRLMLLYTQALLTQVAQTAACNRHHSLRQQLCRWLLTQADRAPSMVLRVTQQGVADSLGVRREGVTEATGKLHDAGLIRHGRGSIEILDRAGLEKQACACYCILRKEFEKILRPRQVDLA
ncbi:Crp/Fnr family transcriptional regulator [Caballeronia sp. GAWG1-1]|uniref:Crp/Fnr family transcriptional regulator n=1 Tax=Caballeronia sp. GAWG1-1 TaxID=2921742 RepID=UPI002027C32B|nr:Crp/Fnr family transcriptional regulator [Caballeronia sp. GAWG1-1]